MITKIEFTDFRGKSNTLELGKITKFIGKNKTGKTSIREAICFVLTGTDSRGNRAPVHLISDDKNQTKVSITTTKAVISRTLNRKSKGGTLKLTREGLDTPLTQTQLDGMIAPKDLFLSVFVPGYFLSSCMNSARRLTVLSQVLPKIDRKALVEEMLGTSLSNEELGMWGKLFEKRPDIMAAKISETKRSYQRQYDLNLGKIQEIKNLPPTPIKPVLSPLAAQSGQLQVVEKKWDDYKRDLETYNSRKHRINEVRSSNARKDVETSELQKELNSIELAGVPDTISLEPEKKELRLSLKVVLPQPLQRNLAEDPHCSACGQMVGKAHRDKVIADNELAQTEWQSNVGEVRAWNADINKKVSDLEESETDSNKKYNEAVNYNLRVSNQKKVLEVKLQALSHEVVPELGVEPCPPSEPLPSEAAQTEAKEAEKQFQRECALYEDTNNRYRDAAVKIEKLEGSNRLGAEMIERVSRIVECVLAVPQEELKRQASSLEIPGYILAVSDDVRLKSGVGMPSDMMSYGEHMKACNTLSLKLNSLMKRRINMIFVDNAESNDDTGLDGLADEGRQVFAAYMDPKLHDLTVEILK